VTYQPSPLRMKGGGEQASNGPPRRRQVCGERLGDALAHLEDARALRALVLVGRHEGSRYQGKWPCQAEVPWGRSSESSALLSLPRLPDAR